MLVVEILITIYLLVEYFVDWLSTTEYWEELITMEDLENMEKLKDLNNKQ